VTNANDSVPPIPAPPAAPKAAAKKPAAQASAAKSPAPKSPAAKSPAAKATAAKAPAPAARASAFTQAVAVPESIAPVEPAPAPPQPASVAPAAPPYGPVPVVSTAPQGLAIASMVTGIVGLLFNFVAFGFLPSLAAVITGHLAQRRQPAARVYWLTGLITGYLGIGISLIIGVFVLIWIIALIGITAGYATNPYSS